MKAEDIHLGDWGRILMGQVPATFFVEAFIRVFFIYLILTVSMRLMGKRMASRISRNELVAMVTMAAAIGIPIQSPDRGLLPAVIIAVLVVLIERGIAAWAFNNQKFEKIS